MPGIEAALPDSPQGGAAIDGEHSPAKDAVASASPQPREAPADSSGTAPAPRSDDGRQAKCPSRAESAGQPPVTVTDLATGGVPISPDVFWRDLVEAVRRARQPLLAGALSRACPLAVSADLVRIGFGPQERMAREQVLRSQREIETFLQKELGSPCALAIEDVSAEQARGSLAEQARTQREEREERQRRACQDCDAVNLVQKILKARIDRIDLFESAEADFSQAEFSADDSQEP